MRFHCDITCSKQEYISFAIVKVVLNCAEECPTPPIGRFEVSSENPVFGFVWMTAEAPVPDSASDLVVYVSQYILAIYLLVVVTPTAKSWI